jgi:ABC-2 type transport system permease protein
MAWIILFAMLIFSSMVSSVSSVFLSKDNEIIFAAPTPPEKIFFMRYTTTSIYTAWMMVIFSLPIFAAYGHVFKAGLLYMPLMIFCVIATAATASCFGMLAAIILVNLFPARRTKDIVLYLSLCFGIFIYVMFRLLRPEDLVNPDKFGSFVDYLSSISTPAGPYIPAAWASNLLSLFLMDRQIDWLLLGLIATTPFCLYIAGEWVMKRWFFPGYSKSQESFGGYRRFKGPKNYHHPMLWAFGKEIRFFLRDSSEWSQTFMIAALVIVYLYNFKLLPIDRSYVKEEYITNLISFLNIGLTGFIVASLAARFAYPSIGSEGGSFYIIKSSPLSLKRFLLQKYLFYAIPFTLLALILVIASDYLLSITGPMWTLSIITILIITWAVVALAIGFGALYADFTAENRTAALGNIGSILFLMTAMTFEFVVIALGAYPSYWLVKKWLTGQTVTFVDILLLVSWLILSLFIAIGLPYYFFAKGLKTLESG